MVARTNRHGVSNFVRGAEAATPKHSGVVGRRGDFLTVRGGVAAASCVDHFPNALEFDRSLCDDQSHGSWATTPGGRRVVNGAPDNPGSPTEGSTMRGMSRSACGVFAALVLAVAASTSIAQTEPKVRIGWNINLGNAPAPIAAEQGIFGKHGIDADVRSYGSGPVLTQAMATKQIDIAYVGFAPAYNWLEKDLKTVALVQSSYGLGSIVGRTDSGIKDPAELRGKTIAGSRKGSGNDAILRVLLLRELARLEPERDVQIVGMGEETKGATLLDKKVDAAFLVEPFTSEVLATGQV